MASNFFFFTTNWICETLYRRFDKTDGRTFGSTSFICCLTVERTPWADEVVTWGTKGVAPAICQSQKKTSEDFHLFEINTRSYCTLLYRIWMWASPKHMSVSALCSESLCSGCVLILSGVVIHSWLGDHVGSLFKPSMNLFLLSFKLVLYGVINAVKLNTPCFTE